MEPVKVLGTGRLLPHFCCQGLYGAGRESSWLTKYRHRHRRESGSTVVALQVTRPNNMRASVVFLLIPPARGPDRSRGKLAAHPSMLRLIPPPRRLHDGAPVASTNRSFITFWRRPVKPLHSCCFVGSDLLLFIRLLDVSLFHWVFSRGFSTVIPGTSGHHSQLTALCRALERVQGERP